MDTSIPIREGTIPFRGYRTWYRIVGDHEDPGKLPLLCLHGGPGASWDYLEPLEGVYNTGRRVIFYDQLGGGNSDVPGDPSMYTLNLYLDELAAIRSSLGLEQVHILGHSWGGILALEYALTQPAGLAGLILSDTAASMPQWAAEAKRLVAELPTDTQWTLEKHFLEGTTDSPEYRDAYRVFSRRHILPLDPKPGYWTRAAGKRGDEVYRTMWGLSEIHITGNLKDWDVTNRLGEIHVPALVLCGRYDEATPALAEIIHQGITGSERVIFENSAHAPYVQETERYLQVLDQFLNRVESMLWTSGGDILLSKPHHASPGHRPGESLRQLNHSL